MTTGPAITPEVQIVLAWHAALNSGDVEKLVSLSTEHVEVGGPRGVGRGVELLRDWVARARLRLEPLNWQVPESTSSVVVVESAQWQTPDGELTPAQEVASVFRLEDGRVSSVLRYDDLEAAMSAARMARRI